MLKYNEKRQIEKVMESYILAAPAGINTRILIHKVYITVKPTIKSINKHHLAGMLSWVYKHYKHTFLVRTHGHSIII